MDGRPAVKGGNSQSNSGVPRVESSLALYIQSGALQDIAFHLRPPRVRPRASAEEMSHFMVGAQA
jgi:hypothetical protein